MSPCRRPREALMWTLCVAACLLLFVANLLVGSVAIPVAEVFHILGGDSAVDAVHRVIVLKSRLPQSLTALVAGAALGISGLMMQTVFRNPLAGPSVLGVSSGAALGVAFVVLLSGSVGGVALSSLGVVGEIGITIAAMAGALAVMALIAGLSARVRDSVALLVAGVMIGYMASAVIGVLKFFSAEEDVRAYVIWGLGSFARVSGGQTLTFVVLTLCLIPPALMCVKPLNLLMLGDMYAANLGLDVRRARLSVITVSGVIVAVVTAFCGPIVFLGLAVPHLCRGLLRTSDHRLLMPATLVTGAALALLCNLISRLPGFEGAMPVNSVTALIGAPIVVRVLLSRRRKTTP